jgi:excisionase family DNA binding protein
MAEATHQIPTVPDAVGGYELAEQLTGLKRSTLYALVHERRIPHVRLSGRLVRFRADEVRAWLESHRVAGK